METCKIDHCHKRVQTGGLCPMHYQRQRRHGSTEAVLKKGRPRKGPAPPPPPRQVPAEVLKLTAAGKMTQADPRPPRTIEAWERKHILDTLDGLYEDAPEVVRAWVERRFRVT